MFQPIRDLTCAIDLDDLVVCGKEVALLGKHEAAARVDEQ
jgi:hypothetical protein